MTRAGFTAQLLVAVLVVMLVRGPALALPPLPSVAAAAAPHGPRVGVAVFCLDKKVRAEAGRWEQALEDAVLKADRFELVPSIDLYDSAGAKSRAGNRAEAEARLKDGAKALDDLDNQKATEASAAAVRSLQETDLSLTWRQLLDAVRLKAAAHATGGENGPAKQELERLLALDPSATPSATYFSPDLLKFVETQRRLFQSARGELKVSTWPAGARVWVDGTPRGLGPVTVSGLSGGKHFVTVKLGGYALSQSELALGEHTIELKPAQDSGAFLTAEKAVAKDAAGPGRDAALRALLKRLGLDQLVAVVLKKSVAGEKVDAVALRLDARDGHNWAFAQATVGMGDAAGVEALALRLTAKDEPRQGGPVTHFVGGGAPPGRIAGFALLGAGALLVGTGIFFGVQAQAQADQFRRTPQVQTVAAQNLANDGRTFSVVADVAYLAGAASLVTGAVLALRSGSGGEGEAPSPAPEPKKKAGSDKKKPAASSSEFGKRSGEDDQRRRDEEEQKKKDDDERRRKDEEDKKRKDDEERAQAEAADKKKRDDEARVDEKKRDEAARDSKKDKKKTKREREEERREAEQRRKDDERKKREDERKQAEDEKRRLDEELKRKKEEAEKKKKSEDHDDLRNF